MDYASYDSIWIELRHILLDERIEIIYEDFRRLPGDLKEGEYRIATPNKIYIDEMYRQKDVNIINNEPLIIAHELGHYFDIMSDNDASVSQSVRESRANDYMIEISKRHNLLSDALKERKRRESA